LAITAPSRRRGLPEKLHPRSLSQLGRGNAERRELRPIYENSLTERRQHLAHRAGLQVPERRHGEQRWFPVAGLRLPGHGERAWIVEEQRSGFHFRGRNQATALLPLNPAGIARLHEIRESTAFPDVLLLHEMVQASPGGRGSDRERVASHCPFE